MFHVLKAEMAHEDDQCQDFIRIFRAWCRERDLRRAYLLEKRTNMEWFKLTDQKQDQVVAMMFDKESMVFKVLNIFKGRVDEFI